MITSTPILSKREFEDGTGWALKPEGACKGDICIPLPDFDGDDVDIRQLAQWLGLPLVDEAGVWAIGADTVGMRALHSAEAPILTLPTHEGEEFNLGSLVGEKVVLLAWAPY